MRLQMFAFRDSVSESFGPPLGAINLQTFLRDTVEPQLTGQSSISKNPQDFSVFGLGVFDTETGIFEPLKAPVNHGAVSDFKKS